MMNESELQLVQEMDAMANEDTSTSKEFKPMSDSELVAVCMEELARGIGGNVSTDNEEDISLSLDYYLGRLPAITKVKAKDPNASKFVSQDVMDGVEATVAEIMPAFVTDNIGVYEPDDERDVDSAQVETDIVNYLFLEQYDGYTLIQEALKDALLHRNCTAKAYWDERKVVTYEVHEDVPEMALGQIMQPNAEDQTVEVVEQYITEEANPEATMVLRNHQAQMQDPAYQMQMQQNPQAMQQMQQQMQELMMDSQDKYSIKIKRVTVEGKPVIKCVAPEQVIVCGDHDSPYLHDVRFSAHEMIETRSSMIEQGFDPEIVKTIPEYNSAIDNISRQRTNEEEDYTSAHDSTKLLRVFECYILIDFDGDGIAERRKVVLGGNKILSNEEIDDVAMVGGVCTAMPHKYKGISMFDRLKDIQDAKTPIMRSVIDGTQLSSNPRLGVVTGQANLDDILTSRTGGIVRADNPNSVFQIPTAEVPQSSYTMLEFMDGIRKDRGGGAIDVSSQAQSIAGNTAHGIERVMSAMEMNNAMLARTFAETFIRGIFIEMHNLLRKHHNGILTAQVGGQFVNTMPSQWKKRTHVTVHVGSSHAERARQANVMNNIVIMQKELASIGSPLYSQDMLYRAMTDAVRLGGIKSPERYFLDPSSPEGQQANQQSSQQQQEMKQKEEAMQAQMVQAQNTLAEAEQMKGMAQMQNTQVKAQNEGLKNEITALKNQMDAMKSAGELQFKREQLEENTALKLTELEISAQRDLSKQNKDNKDDDDDNGEEIESD